MTPPAAPPPPPPSVPASSVWIAGIDLAWGERREDGLCLLRAGIDGSRPAVVAVTAVRGDAELLAGVRGDDDRAAAGLFCCVDAPLVCPNPTGSRPVDRETQRRFGRLHAGCHPANQQRCARPLRVAGLLAAELGCVAGWDWEPAASPARVAAEVYPHLALVRWLELPRIIKYKRGPVDARRREFARLQTLLSAWLARAAPELALCPEARRLLGDAAWTKSVEDRLDALVCALVGYQHWRHRGRRSEVLGDRATGFILAPAAGEAGA